MKTLRYSLLAIAFALCAASQAQHKSALSDKEKLVGAWHLAHIDSPGPQPIGILIYTRDGHMSVQLMYPKSAIALSNQYVQAGYEASFGSFDVDQATHTLTHHVLGSNTRDLLVGKDLPRIYQFTNDGHLLIKPVQPDEHWSVTWEHY